MKSPVPRQNVPVQNISIDGPAASGKTVVGKLLAEKLGWRFLDTGSMYRVITWIALTRGIKLGDEIALGSLAMQLTIQLNGPTGERVLADGDDVTDFLRRPNVDRAVSQVAKVPGVRSAMVMRQREIALQGPTIVVGRDIGTKVLPEAALKVYLTASLRERALRRHKELTRREESLTFKAVHQDMERRDRIDTEREASPLRPARDAKTLHTDGLSIEQVVEQILGMRDDDAS